MHIVAEYIMFSIFIPSSAIFWWLFSAGLFCAGRNPEFVPPRWFGSVCVRFRYNVIVSIVRHEYWSRINHVLNFHSFVSNFLWLFSAGLFCVARDPEFVPPRWFGSLPLCFTHVFMWMLRSSRGATHFPFESDESNWQAAQLYGFTYNYLGDRIAAQRKDWIEIMCSRSEQHCYLLSPYRRRKPLL